MSTLIDFGAVEEEEQPKEEDTNVTKVRPGALKLDTVLFAVEFKDPEIGNRVVSGSQGFYARDVFNAFADRACFQTADLIVQIRQTLCGNDRVASGDIPIIQTMFDEYGCVKEEFSKHLTDIQVDRVEGNFARMVALRMTLAAIEEQWIENFPLSNKTVQFAYVGAAHSASSGFEIGPIFSLVDAIKFRLLTNARYVSIVAAVKANESLGPNAQALESIF